MKRQCQCPKPGYTMADHRCSKCGHVQIITIQENIVLRLETVVLRLTKAFAALAQQGHAARVARLERW